MHHTNWAWQFGSFQLCARWEIAMKSWRGRKWHVIHNLNLDSSSKIGVTLLTFVNGVTPF
jgi:hypothetical protein